MRAIPVCFSLAILVALTQGVRAEDAGKGSVFTPIIKPQDILYWRPLRYQDRFAQIGVRISIDRLYTFRFIQKIRGSTGSSSFTIKPEPSSRVLTRG